MIKKSSFVEIKLYKTNIVFTVMKNETNLKLPKNSEKLFDESRLPLPTLTVAMRKSTLNNTRLRLSVNCNFKLYYMLVGRKWLVVLHSGLQNTFELRVFN